ncbi:MAG TPA: hypothetical protein VKU92_07270 [Acidimicrobiales bacterium]|nr:hypothetical protein [Acidimicrobiales bacterium]
MSRRRPPGCTAALALCAAALLLSACTSYRAGLGPRDAICFSSFPEARRAVGPEPQFAGVRYVSASTLVADLRRIRRHHIVVPDALSDFGQTGACLFGYHLGASRSPLPGSWHPLSGPYRFAVVVVDQQTHRVVTVVVLPRPPLRFSHLI